MLVASIEILLRTRNYGQTPSIGVQNDQKLPYFPLPSSKRKLGNKTTCEQNFEVVEETL